MSHNYIYRPRVERTAADYAPLKYPRRDARIGPPSIIGPHLAIALILGAAVVLGFAWSVAP